jgi:lipopolysaccharide transport system permease protein
MKPVSTPAPRAHPDAGAPPARVNGAEPPAESPGVPTAAFSGPAASAVSAAGASGLPLPPAPDAPQLRADHRHVAETVVRAQDRAIGLWSGLREILTFRELLWSLTMREIRVRYKQTALGVAWAVVQPIAMVIVFTVIFGRFAKLPSEGVPYPIFAFCALLPWTYFSSALSRASNSLVENGNLLKKVYFPRPILPLAIVIAHGVDFLAASVVFAGLIVYFGVSIGPTALYAVPLLAIQVAFLSGVALFFSALNTFYRDVRHVIPVLVQLWLYATPVVWSLPIVPESLRLLYVASNPMAAVIDGFRQSIVHRAAPDAATMLVAAAATAVVLLLGYRYFRYVERYMADVV